MKKHNVLGIGTIQVDELYLLDQYPIENLRVKIRESFEEIAGSVPMALATAVGLGCGARFLGAVGDDTQGIYMRTRLRELGIDDSLLKEQAHSTSGFSQTWVSHQSGSRTTVYTDRTLMPLSPSDVDDSILEGIQLVHTDAHEPDAMRYLVHLARRRGIPIMHDAGDLQPGSADLLKSADIVMAPLRFVQALTKNAHLPLQDAPSHIIEYGARTVIITDAERGCAYWESGSGTEYLPTYNIEVKNSIGVGDFFAGAFIAQYLDGKHLDESVKYATAAASIMCGRVRRDKIPQDAEIREFMSKHKTDTQ